MSVSIPLALLLLIVVIVLMRGGYVRLGSAVACALCGFFVASTDVAPAVIAAVGAVTAALGSLTP